MNAIDKNWSPRRRRGAAVILVLGLLAIALATAYALTRTQFQAFQLQQNSQRKAEAQQAAAAGLFATLRRMHESDWEGVAATVTSNVAAGRWYVATLATGDPELSSDDEDYDRYPYRVTITSIGYAMDSANPGAPTTHAMTMVVELAPRMLSSEPAGWTDALDYTVNQWKADGDDNFLITPRVRLEGDVRIRGPLGICNGAPNDWSAKQTWLGHLRDMYLQSMTDYRPFNGRVDLDFASTGAATRSLLTGELGLSVVDLADAGLDPSHPGAVSSYQLYPGGETYSVPQVGASLEDLTLEADPITNPLGVFVSSGALELRDNAKVRGTLIVGSSDLSIVGEGVELTCVDLPPLRNTTSPIRLPTALVRDDIRIAGNTSGAFEGLVAAWDDFEVAAALQNTINFTYQGRLLCKELLIHARTEWLYDEGWWSDRLAEFSLQEQVGEPFFPNWLGTHRGLPPQPILTVQPESAAVTYHWQDWSQPVFVPHPDDEGLRWEIIRWSDSP